MNFIIRKEFRFFFILLEKKLNAKNREKMNEFSIFLINFFFD